MPTCGHPTRNGTPCKRKSPYCWQHRAKKWNIGGAALALIAVVSLLMNFVETPRYKIGTSESAQIGPPMAPTGLTVMVGVEPAKPTGQALTELTRTKVNHPSAQPSESEKPLEPTNLSAKPSEPGRPFEPANTSPGIGSRSSLSASVGLTENNVTTDSVTAILNHQSPPIGLADDNKSQSGLGAQQISSALISFPDNKGLPSSLEVQQQPPATTIVNFSDIGRSLPGVLQTEQQTPALASIVFSNTIGDANKLPGLSDEQQSPPFKSLIKSSEDYLISQPLKRIEQ
jgi:hypothetical protein